jgi:uncharacterized protein
VIVASIWWLLLVSAAASALGGLLGMASGIFIVPLLTLFGHFDIRSAIGASLISVIACSCGSGAAFLREQLTNIRLAVVLEVATTLGAATGVLLFGLIPTKFLYVLFAAIMFVSAQQMLRRRHERAAAPGAEPAGPSPWRRLHGSYTDRETGRQTHYLVQRLPLGLGLMYGAGLISALLGIGSGVLKVPAMDSAMCLPIKVSSATSNFMIAVTASAGAAAYFISGRIDPRIAGPVALGSVLGAILGARLLLRVSAERLRLLFVMILLLLGAQMVLAALGVSFAAGAG